ncbi:quinone-dependent dihydroorotate dehydrogenase [Arsenicicoccus sp. oral taxon 190]|uniref:quinone-dependent dihydroorotate dehydrogenase n=1 Tax=Arsenicicoccus sp. oral taxon 190 TaxID=1658671 RepID=UPI000679FD18|nr:quinone-dependent dihydroorotate dehydrogenase [Arsenicicoccus sp. oral taxon 190]AKT50637.1 dihydroorotate dehydrogenase [Arsenicicoccus sp. oral taxon 190]
MSLLDRSYDHLLRPTLYALSGGDAETVHHRTLGALARLDRRPGLLSPLAARTRTDDPVTVAGVRFPNRVGLAAGMDKDGRALSVWPALGFGFVEVGTVTRHPQPGNDRPRLFTLAASDAVINRMGFNNDGADALADRLDRRRPAGTLGISIGKSKVTPLPDAVADYRYSFGRLAGHADYVALNVSSPNTPGLRALQDEGALREILSALVADSAAMTRQVPIWVKVAPDLTDHALAQLLAVCLEEGVAGIIATNTTVGRSGLAQADLGRASEAGGLSGAPLRRRALEVVALVHRETGGALPVMGVGGIRTPDDARAMLAAGASLVQVYSAFALHGPGVVPAIARSLRTAQG